MASAALVQCTFFANRAPWGGNISADCSGDITVDGCIVAGGVQGVGLYVAEDGTSSAVLTCTDIWGNQDGDWVGPIADQLGMDGNISADPQFCDSGTDDFTLAETSPCAPEYSGGCGQIGAWPVGCGPVAVDPGTAPVCRVVLAPNVPNPFNPATTMHYSIPAGGDVRLTIHAVDGRLVSTLVDGPRVSGEHEVVWHGHDAEGRPASSGIYLAILVAGGERHVRSLALLR